LLTSKSKLGAPSGPPSPRMQLAARSCILYLDRCLNQKKAGISSLSSEANFSSIDNNNTNNDDNEGEVELDQDNDVISPKTRASSFGASHFGVGSGGIAGSGAGSGVGGREPSLLSTAHVGTKRDRDILEGLDKLMGLKNNEHFANSSFDGFFAEIQNLMSPLFDFSHLKGVLTQQLAPIAPYLENL